MEIYCLKGACSSPRLFGVVLSLRTGAGNSGDLPDLGPLAQRVAQPGPGTDRVGPKGRRTSLTVPGKID